MTSERVLVVPRDAVPDGAAWYGLRTEGLEAFLASVSAVGRFEPRAAMEEDPTFKQLIPYLVLRDGPAYFLMRRTRAGADARLHDRWSIGVGGHLGETDEAHGAGDEQPEAGQERSVLRHGGWQVCGHDGDGRHHHRADEGARVPADDLVRQHLSAPRGVQHQEQRRQ